MRVLIAIAMLVCAVVNGATLLSYQAAPILNPLKGFVPYQSWTTRSNFPHTLSVDYFPMRDLMTQSNTFNWTTLDASIAAATNERCQFLIRVYLDFPGRTTGIPQFLLDGGLVTNGYSNNGNTTSVSPDWENPSLRFAMTNFVAHYAARYDGDPRIGATTLGLLGFWGEWHDEAPVVWASTNVQTEVLTAYTNYFKQTPVLARLPRIDTSTDIGNSFANVGYHDDGFGTSTMDPFNTTGFTRNLTNAGCQLKWLTNMIGGEVDPPVWDCFFSTPSCGWHGDFTYCATNTHVSWLMNQGAFSTTSDVGTNPVARASALAGAQLMGYEIYCSSWNWTSASNIVMVTLTNTGIAPFYYPWVVQVLADAQSWNTTWDLRAIKPGMSTNYSVALTGMSAGQHSIGLKVVNPMAGGYPFIFANTTVNTNTGVLTLGTVGVTTAGLNATDVRVTGTALIGVGP